MTEADGFTDTSDEELLVRRGDVPAEWYVNEQHLGYSAQGQRVGKPASKSAVDELIAAEENPDFWKTVYDELNNTTITLSDAQIELLRRIKDRAYVSDSIRDGDYSVPLDPQPYPMSHVQVSKRRFTPSLHERQRINRIIHAFKMGWLKREDNLVFSSPIEDFVGRVRDLWTGGRSEAEPELPPPPLTLPGHASSYNPPPEYFAQPPPAKSSLRELEANPRAFHEQFERLMALYLAPRQRRRKITMTARDLLPPPPDLEEMRPFPSKCITRASFRQNQLRAVDASGDGVFLVVVDEFNNVAMMHVLTLRLLATLTIRSDNVLLTRFTKQRGVLVCSEEFVDFFIPRTNRERASAALDAFRQLRSAGGVDGGTVVSFPFLSTEGSNGCVSHGCRLSFTDLRIRAVSLHAKENFLALLCASRDGAQVIKVFNLARFTSTIITLKTKTRIESIAFSPKFAQLLVMTRTYLYVYDLKKQERVKRLISGSQGLACMAVHASGTQVLVGAKDQHLLWYDLEWKDLPLRKMKVHSGGVNSCCFSSHYRLFASAGDDGAVVVQFLKLDESGIESPAVFPLKTLRGHKVVHSTGVTDVQFVGSTHWLVSVGHDGGILVWG